MNTSLRSAARLCIEHIEPITQRRAAVAADNHVTCREANHDMTWSLVGKLKGGDGMIGELEGNPHLRRYRPGLRPRFNLKRDVAVRGIFQIRTCP